MTLDNPLAGEFYPIYRRVGSDSLTFQIKGRFTIDGDTNEATRYLVGEQIFAFDLRAAKSKQERFYMNVTVDPVLIDPVEGVYEYTIALIANRGLNNNNTNSTSLASSAALRKTHEAGGFVGITTDPVYLAELKETFKSNTTQIDDAISGEAFAVNDQLSEHTDGKWYKYHNVNYPNWRGTAGFVATAADEIGTAFLPGYLVPGYSALTIGAQTYADNGGTTVQVETATTTPIGYAESATENRLQSLAPASITELSQVQVEDSVSTVFGTVSGERMAQSIAVNSPSTNTGFLWSSSASAADNNWNGVAYGNGLFVAVASSGTGNRVMTSPDGVNWTIQVSAADNFWYDIAYGGGLFVAVALTGTNNRVMTSPDGVNWTIRVSAADNGWYGVTYEGGLFVAVSNDGTGNRVMTSPDGINWTIRVSAADNSWDGVAYGNGLFVAVASSGTGNRVMTSPDGINWTIRVSAADNSWDGVAYGNGLFVAVASTGVGDRVMTSPDGINWTIRVSAADNNWQHIAYGGGRFVAVANGGTGDGVMTSNDGISWTTRIPGSDSNWVGVAFGNNLFVATGNTGTRAMVSE